MRCSRCGSNVPDFLWDGNDHPVMIQGAPMIMNMEEPNPDKYEIKVTATVKVGKEWCSTVFPKLETKEVNGVECVVIHLPDSYRKPLIAYCSGKQMVLPNENDKRPVALCEACLQKSMRENYA